MALFEQRLYVLFVILALIGVMKYGLLVPTLSSILPWPITILAAISMNEIDYQAMRVRQLDSVIFKFWINKTISECWRIHLLRFLEMILCIQWINIITHQFWKGSITQWSFLLLTRLLSGKHINILYSFQQTFFSSFSQNLKLDVLKDGSFI